ncbi:MAG: hypothetical protein PGN13_15320 [Patulibacter minatonensis]
MTRPSPTAMYEEMARLGRAMHWSADDLLDLEHGERRRWLHHALLLEAS